MSNFQPGYCSPGVFSLDHFTPTNHSHPLGILTHELYSGIGFPRSRKTKKAHRLVPEPGAAAALTPGVTISGRLYCKAASTTTDESQSCLGFVPCILERLHWVLALNSPWRPLHFQVLTTTSHKTPERGICPSNKGKGKASSTLVLG